MGRRRGDELTPGRPTYSLFGVSAKSNSSNCHILNIILLMMSKIVCDDMGAGSKGQEGGCGRQKEWTMRTYDKQQPSLGWCDKDKGK
jgi:hypothetical protein